MNQLLAGSSLSKNKQEVLTNENLQHLRIVVSIKPADIDHILKLIPAINVLNFSCFISKFNCYVVPELNPILFKFVILNLFYLLKNLQNYFN